MASDSYTYALRPPCKSQSVEFCDSGYYSNNSGYTKSTSMGVFSVTDGQYGQYGWPPPMNRKIRHAFSENYSPGTTRKGDSRADLRTYSENGASSSDFLVHSSASMTTPSYAVLVAPTSCYCDPLMDAPPRPHSRPGSKAAAAQTSRPLPPVPLSNSTSSASQRSCDTVKQREPQVKSRSRARTRQVRVRTTPTCVTWFKKIKVFQKFQKKIGLGLGSRGGSSPANMPPLLFNSVHGENVSVTDNGTVARRVSSFCKAIVFSDRPVRVNEKVCIRFLEVSTNWSGVLRFGFASVDPSTMRSCLPRYACPDLTTKNGFWAKAFSDVHVKKDAILYYYVNSAGFVNFGIDGEEKGVFFSGVDTRGPLWALVDIYGNTTGIELVDARAHLNNLRRNHADTMNNAASSLVPSLSSLSLGGGVSTSDNTEYPSSRYYPNVVPGSIFFHRIKGQHAEVGQNRFTACRRTNEYSNGYVFTARPIEFGEGFVVKIQQSDSEFASSMAFGVTSCDPELIRSFDLPDDSHLLLDRPEYWVVKKDAGNSPITGDELCFTFTQSGEILMSKNAGSPSTLMHVDNSIPLWAFFDLYGTTTKICLVGKVTRTNSDNAANMAERRGLPSHVPRSGIPRSQSSTIPGLVPSVNLPAAQVNKSQINLRPVPLPVPSAPSSQQINGNSNAFNQTVNNGVLDRQGLSTPSEPSNREPKNWSVECVICCERPVDSCFYSCGHMCMCYECAYNYWKTKDKGYCPICRSVIADVIKTYHS